METNALMRIVYKPKIKRLFDLNSGVCYLKMRGSIYFLASKKQDSIKILQKNVEYEQKTPIEFYNITHEFFLRQTEKTRLTEEKKQKSYDIMRIVRNKRKIEKLKAEIKELENKNGKTRNKQN